MKAKTDSAINPKHFLADPGTAFDFAGMISKAEWRWTTQWQAASPSKRRISLPRVPICARDR